MQNLSQYIPRIREHDTSLWSDDVATQATIGERLGWTTLPQQAQALSPLLSELAAMADERKITDVILIGMGGSSLAPYVFAQTYADRSKRILHVMDTTCPENITALVRSLDFTKTLIIVSSKSGTTLETITLEELFWDLAAKDLPDPKSRATHFIAITDPDTPLALRAQAREYHLVTSPADVGGRFSALSVFGLVPAALIGIDTDALIEEAIEAQHACASENADNLAIGLAGELWTHLQNGNDKLPLPDKPLSIWLEQLLAESLGKEGKGIIPFTGPQVCCCHGPIMPCPDSPLAVEHSLLARFGGLTCCALKPAEQTDVASVSEAMVVWQWAVAILGALLRLNPYDQPNVANSKASVLRVLEHFDNAQLDASVRENSIPLEELLESANKGDYLCVLAYVDDEQYHFLKEHYVSLLAQQTSLPISLVQGPRYLHSIGQLHEGGPNSGIFVVIDNSSADEANITLPHVDYTMREFFDAQRIGDVIALRARDRRVTMLRMSEIEQLV